MQKLYHVSHRANLTMLEPKVSTHGKPYVYATSCLEVALLFGSNRSFGDLDGAYGGGSNGVKPYFYEAYEGALKRRFEGVTCYIYEVDSTNFKEGQTSYKAEVVSEQPVKILNCTKVDDLYNILLKLNKENKIDIKFYNKEDPQYVKTLSEHIKNRIQLFGILQNKQGVQYEFCKKYHAQILKELEKDKN